MLKKSLS
jgi:Ca2+/Na+ antiporter